MTGTCADGPSSVAAAFNCNMHRAARLLAPVRYAAERSVDPRRYDALPMVRSLHRRLLKESRLHGQLDHAAQGVGSSSLHLGGVGRWVFW
jgi:hypothetical protein